MNIPFAIQHKNKMRERGSYAGGDGPRGAVVHFTAGRYENGLEDAKRCIDGGIENGYSYLCIARTGELVQAHDIMKWGYHAGESAWKLPVKRATWKIVGGVSDDLIGIEMNCAGRLGKVGNHYYPYWEFDDNKAKDGGSLTFNPKPIPDDQVRFISKDLAKAWNCPWGYYHKYSAEQEETLIKTLLWLYVNSEPFKIDAILGHHEVSGIPGIGFWRKNDPGGSLSMPMSELREYLEENRHELIVRYGIKKSGQESTR